jgi:hypothetical protein
MKSIQHFISTVSTKSMESYIVEGGDQGITAKMKLTGLKKTKKLDVLETVVFGVAERISPFSLARIKAVKRLADDGFHQLQRFVQA